MRKKGLSFVSRDRSHLSEMSVMASDEWTESYRATRIVFWGSTVVGILGIVLALNAALSAMPGIRDGVVIHETVDGEDRLSVLVVLDPSGAMDAKALRQAVRAHMREHFDPVFVPRRIHIVDRLPRGGTGKISASDLAALVDAELKPAAQRAARPD